MSDKCLDCPVPSADMDGFIVSGPGGAPRSESAGVSSSEGPFAKEAPQTGHFILKGKVSSSSPLPDVPEPGWAYESAEAGTYGGVQATAGDLVWCAGVNPVRWAILQSDSGSGGSSVSVQQVLSSGTKIATVMVDGQATDLYCETGGGIQTLSGGFGCETREISPAVDEPASFSTTRMVFLDQTGYETLESGNIPYDHFSYAFSGSDRLDHYSASFTTAVPASAPYAVALKTYKPTPEPGIYYCLKSSDISDWQYGEAVKVSDLLAAGETGAKLVSIGEIPYGDGTLDVYASFSANQDGSYTVSYSARKDAVTEDVLTAKIDGKDGSGETVSSVDVSPLLNYIGGKVEEVRSQGQVPLTDVRGLNPSDAVFPVYWNNSASGNAFFNAGNVDIATVSYSVSDGSETFVLASGSSPAYFYPYYIRIDSISFSPIYYYFVPEFEGSTNSVEVSLDDLLSGPVELQEYMAADQQSAPSPTGNTITLVMEAVEGDAPTYRCSLYAATGEAKKVLRLYPSCDGEIDLSGICSEGGSSVKAGTGLIMEDGEIRLAMRKSQQHTIQIPSQYNTPYTYIYGDEDDDYEYNPSPYVIDVSSFEEKPVSLYISLLASMLTPQEITTMKNDLKSVLVDVEWKSGVTNRIYVDIASTDWRSNSLMFYINVQKPAPLPEYPDAGVFDELESVTMVMLNTTDHVGNSIGTYFPKMQLVIHATYWG